MYTFATNAQAHLALCRCLQSTARGTHEGACGEGVVIDTWYILQYTLKIRVSAPALADFVGTAVDKGEGTNHLTVCLSTSVSIPFGKERFSTITPWGGGHANPSRALRYISRQHYAGACVRVDPLNRNSSTMKTMNVIVFVFCMYVTET